MSAFATFHPLPAERLDDLVRSGAPAENPVWSFLRDSALELEDLPWSGYVLLESSRA